MKTIRYAARILFEYRVTPTRWKRTTCEERIVVLRALDAEDAYRKAAALAKEREFEYENALGGTVQVRFLGFVDLLELDPVCEKDEVWYSTFATVEPSKRLRRKADLAAFQEMPPELGENVRFAPGE